MDINLIKVGMRIRFRRNNASFRGLWMEGRVSRIWNPNGFEVALVENYLRAYFNFQDGYEVEEVVCLKRDSNEKD